MEILGALKKSQTQTTIYFYEYNNKDFKWEDIEALLQNCLSPHPCVSEESIYCIAVESFDEMETKSRMVGLTFRSGAEYICLVSNGYYELDYYLKEISQPTTEGEDL